MSKDKILEQLESGRVGTEEQLSELEKTINFHKEIRKLQVEKMDLNEQIAKIAAAKPRAVEPTHEFQKEDKYWELEAELRIKNFQLDKLNFESQLEHLDKTIKAKEEEYSRLKGE